MLFLVLLITLCAYKLPGFRMEDPYDNWFSSLHAALSRYLRNWPLLLMLAVLLLPLIVVYYLLSFFENWLFGLLGIALQAAILFYALGRGNLFEQTETYLEHWREGQFQSSYHYATRYFRVPHAVDIDNVEQMHKTVRAGLFYQWFEQVFVIVFWFILAGPIAALFIRLLALYEQSQSNLKPTDEQMPLQIQHALEWLPARILALTFAIAGNFTMCFKVWSSAIMNWKMPTQDVLHTSGMAALGVCEAGENFGQKPRSNAKHDNTPDAALLSAYATELETIQELVIRSLVVWILVLAVVTIF